MRFIATPLPGAYLLEPDRHLDDRGFFARTWCQREFARHAISVEWVQCSVSFTDKKGTLRGMHYQTAPHPEAKLVRCTRGAIYDVLVDLRPNSPTLRKWAAFELTAESRSQLFIPAGLAHGFQTLVDDTEVFYQMSEFYHPECAAGVRWNDPAFGIVWPAGQQLISPRDQQFPDFEQ